MAQVFKSGAFIQQCFASHPLCLTVRKFTVPDVMILQCSACHFRHDIRIRAMTSRSSAAASDPRQHPAEQTAEQYLAYCAGQHPTALRISGIEVTEDAVEMRCGDCRRSFGVEAAAFATHAP